MFLQQVFRVHQTTVFEAYFTLEQPLVAQMLKLNVEHSVSEESNRSCWNLKILGCTLREGAI